MILSLDPGETLGIAKIDWKGNLLAARQVKLAGKEGLDYERVLGLLETLTPLPEVIVLEDYRVYASKAMAHIGRRLYTAELIGAVELYAAQAVIEVVRLAASLKGRWPTARLVKFFTQTLKTVPKPHAFDAWVLGLCYLEMFVDWSPLKGRE